MGRKEGKGAFSGGMHWSLKTGGQGRGGWGCMKLCSVQNTGLSLYCVRFVAESSQVTNATKVKTGLCVSVCVCSQVTNATKVKTGLCVYMHTSVCVCMACGCV